MNNYDFIPELPRGKIKAIKIDVEFPDGTRKIFDVSNIKEIGGVLFDDGLVKGFLSNYAEQGDNTWQKGIKIWEAKDLKWQSRPSFLLLPKVEFNRCGSGNCPAAGNGQCVGGGQCARE